MRVGGVHEFVFVAWDIYLEVRASGPVFPFIIGGLLAESSRAEDGNARICSIKLNSRRA